MLEVILPEADDPLKAKNIVKAIQNALNASALGAKADYAVTTKTWEHKPTFDITKPTDESRIVSTTDKIYPMVDKGTRPHVIRPRRATFLAFRGGSKAKTSVGVIGSKTGSKGSGPTIFSKGVNHPGTAARNFTIAIRAKWAKEMQLKMNIAIAAAVKV